MLTGNINCQWGNTGSENWKVITKNKFQIDIEVTKAISKEKKNRSSKLSSPFIEGYTEARYSMIYFVSF